MLQPTPFVPMGFGSQIRALGEAQRQQADKIHELEQALAMKDTEVAELECKLPDDSRTQEIKIGMLERNVTMMGEKVETLENKQN